MGRLTILLIDSDHEAASDFRRYMHQRHLPFVAADSIESAFTFGALRDIRLILLNIHLDDAQTPLTLQMLRSRIHPNAAIVVVGTQRRYPDELCSFGCDGYLLKPFTPKNLTHWIVAQPKENQHDLPD